MYNSIEEIKRACREYGVDITNTDGSYRTIYEVLDELSHKVFN